MINLTQHATTPVQREAGVVDLEGERLAELRRLLTIDDLPTAEGILHRAAKIATLAPVGTTTMIGGAPYLMAPLERALRARGSHPVYAFSRRESTETTLPDGSVKKSRCSRTWASWRQSDGLDPHRDRGAAVYASRARGIHSRARAPGPCARRDASRT